jgi:hypothetical protein
VTTTSASWASAPRYSRWLNTSSSPIVARLVVYLIPAFLSALVVVIALGLFSWVPGGIFSQGGDTLWVQAMAQAHAQAGPIGADQHLGWPIGLSPWSHPQLGLFFGIVTWLAGAIGFGSAASTGIVVGAVAALVCAGTTLFLRTVVHDRFKATVVIFSIAVGASPFVIGKLGHFSVAGVFLIPIAFAVTNKRYPTRFRRVAWLSVGAVAAILSPLWWVVVAGFLLFMGLIVSLVSLRGKTAGAWLTGGSACIIGFFVQYLVALGFAESTTIVTRGAWESNFYGGRFVDFLTASPLVNSLVPVQARLSGGGSPEPSMVGIVLVVAAIFAVFLVVAVFPGKIASRDHSYILRTTTTLTLLAFVVGGLGNLQAGLAALMETSSPARVWARLIVVLALLGLAWVLLAVRDTGPGRAFRKTVVAVPILALVSVFVLAEVTSTRTPEPAQAQGFSEYGPVSFLRENLAPCPVAQLPQDDFPLPRALPKDVIDTAYVQGLYYRPFIPYVMAPEFYWSYGSWNPSAKNRMQDLNRTLDDADLEYLKSGGFCAVLYDTRLADVAKTGGKKLEGRDLRVTIPPSYSNERYQVFLLS